MGHLKMAIIITGIKYISIIVFNSRRLAQLLCQFIMVKGTYNNATVAVAGKAEALQGP